MPLFPSRHARVAAMCFASTFLVLLPLMLLTVSQAGRIEVSGPAPSMPIGYDQADSNHTERASPFQQGITPASTFTVINTSNSGAGSLHQAILDANANAGQDQIDFIIPGAGVHTIRPTIALPVITGAVIINGYSQPGSSVNTLANGDNAVLLIELDGTGLAGGAQVHPLIQISVSNCRVRGLVINRAPGAGIFITAASGLLVGNVIEGNFIGTDPSGTIARGNGEGIAITRGNGTAIGGLTHGERNVISGNGGRGIFISSFTSNTTIFGNFVGTSASGTSALGNGAGGIFVGGAGNDLIGAPTVSQRNVISGNVGFGILTQTTAGDVRIQGNLIGTDVTGTVAIGNSSFGIWVNSASSSSNTIIGGGNVISGNKSDGVLISGSSRDNDVFSNLIGTDISGTQALGNLGNGVHIEAFTTRNRIGTATGQANTIAFNSKNGIQVSPGLNSTANSFRRNSIFSNTLLGIDLGGEGVTPNDSGDGDPGPNNVQNFPVITRALTGPTTVINGTLNTTPNSPGGYAVDFYTNASCDSAGGNGEGQTFLGSVTTATTNSSGNVSFAFSPPALTAGQVITATATDSAGNTSEFSPCVTVRTVQPGTIQFSASNYSTFESDTGALLVPVTVTRTGGSDGAVSVHYATSDGSATTVNNDYDPASGDLSWPDGDNTVRTFNVSVRGDVTVEANETINLTLSNVQVATLGSPGTATATIVNDDGVAAIVRFSSGTYNTTESSGSTTITVVRTGDTTQAVTVDYATPDDSEATTVVQCATINGTASPRCDFSTALGTLRFAVGENSKTFTILISQDNFVEGNETLALTLSNLTGGATFGVPATATLTIADDVSEPGTTPNDDPENFVRQHYHDFLNREPDPAGLAFWTNQITPCGTDLQCVEVRRIHVSASFFLSIEFQDTGYLVERLYKSSYGDAVGNSTIGGLHPLPVPVVKFNEFLPDTQKLSQGVIVGQPGWEAVLESNKQAFVAEFVQRTRFANAYPTTLSPALFVDALFTNAGVTPTPADQQAAIDEFGAALNTADLAARGRALRRVAENSTLRTNEVNRAFVLMQFFGYLRRNPNAAQDTDHSGYEFWLTKLNQFNGDFITAEMVKAFISSIEYRHRFAP